MTRNEALAMDIYHWCKEHWLWSDTTMYFDGKALSSNGWEWDGKMPVRQIEEDLYEYADKNPLKYFEYANPETFSMSFEGPLYEVLNAYVPGWVKLEDEFDKIFEKHGYYYELGHAWNLAACEL